MYSKGCDMTDSKKWVWIGVGTMAIVLVAASLAMYGPFREGLQDKEPLNRVDWLLPFGTGFEHSGLYGSPVIVYDQADRTWRLQGDPEWNRAVFLGDRYSEDPSIPEDIWYTPDIAVEDGRLILDFFVWNGAGVDCARADFAMTTATWDASAGPSDDALISGAPVPVPVMDLPAGEWREVRVAADLPVPGPDDAVLLTISLTAPDTLTTQEGSFLSFGPPRVTVIGQGTVASGEGRDTVDSGAIPDQAGASARLPRHRPRSWCRE